MKALRHLRSIIFFLSNQKFVIHQLLHLLVGQSFLSKKVKNFEVKYLARNRILKRKATYGSFQVQFQVCTVFLMFSMP